MNNVIEKYKSYLKYYNDQIDRRKYSDHKNDVVIAYTHLLDKVVLVEGMIRDLENIYEQQETL